MKAALLLFSTVLAGCGTHWPLTARVEVVSKNQTLALRVAKTVAEIERGVGEPRFLSAKSPDMRIRIHSADLEWSTLGQAWVTQDYDEDCKIEINERVIESANYDALDVELIVAHEIGHCLGLEHSANPADIMSAYADDSQRSPESMNRFMQQIKAIRTGVR